MLEKSDIALKMYNYMFLSRKSEYRLWELYREQLVKGTVTSGEGNEAAIVGTTMALDPQRDICNFMQRDFGGYLVWGLSVFHMFNHYLANEESPTGGKDGNVHHGAPQRGLLPMVSHLGTMLPNVVGAVHARRQQGIESLGLAIIGDGGTSTGDVHEAMNIAAVLGTPVIFMIENNQWAYSTPIKHQYACESLSSRAAGYGIRGKTIRATNAMEVYTQVAEIAEELRNHPEPYILETITYRLAGHAAYDTAEYVPREDLEAWRKEDPLEVMRRYIIEQELSTPEELESLERQWEEHISTESNRAIGLAKVSPEKTNWSAYAPSRGEDTPRLPPLSLQGVTPVQAVNAALDHAMEHDPAVILMGEDVGTYGGPFKATKGLFEKYGRPRVLDMPLAESGFTGFAVGAAQMGLRPVVEMQFSDFATDAVTQIGVNAGSYYFRNELGLPVTIRMPTGGGLSYGPFHSADLEGMFGSFPGLKIVYPSFAEDFFSLLIGALYDPNPVMFFESKYLYRRLKGDIEFSGGVDPLEKARIYKEGGDLTLVAYGAAMHECLAAVAAIEAEGDYTIEVVDPRILKPFDFDTLSASVEKTHKLLVVHESWKTGSIGAGIVAEIAQRNFFDLEAPPRLISAPDTPVPFAPELESVYRPSRAGIETALRELLAY
ncbi:alpha-ketoacid dehydrogenase subunit alpha/beta [Spirochaeta lutea]|uniref:alpha-ketoacid dehydrogenase subunit alpha/beta n=1 Tax=Spirochaeta lutea TaxID=1480694 RepID=UPI00068F52FA|nr:alpha-ketoacid dehydrogenase subunit alpha/beta [Spirochaeta lutea]